MAPSLWIHCNICYYLFAKKDRQFFQMNCLHVLCKQCMAAHSKRGTICPVCKRQGGKFVEICNTMDKKVKALYDPGPTKTIDLAARAINFQQKQKQHLIVQLVSTDDKLRKIEKMEQVLRQKIVEYQQKYDKVKGHRRSMQDALRQQMSPEDIEQKQKKHSNLQSDFFESHSSSSGSNRTKMTSGSVDSRDSFLNLKGASSCSIRSADFGTTPSSNRSTGQISKQFHKMKIDHR